MTILCLSMIKYNTFRFLYSFYQNIFKIEFITLCNWQFSDDECTIFPNKAELWSEKLVNKQIEERQRSMNLYIECVLIVEETVRTEYSVQKAKNSQEKGSITYTVLLPVAGSFEVPLILSHAEDAKSSTFSTTSPTLSFILCTRLSLSWVLSLL